mgnify:CR=1 FL=1|jgi:hypothetical protein
MALQVLYSLMGVNVAVFALWRTVDNHWMRDHFTCSAAQVYNMRLHTLLTTAFSHRDFFHLVRSPPSLPLTCLCWLGGRCSEEGPCAKS